MSADLIERLTKPVRMRHRFGSMVEKSSPAIQHEAADALAAKDTALSEMRAELERARKALEPFAREAEVWGGYDEDEALVEGWNGGPASQLIVAHLRNAARAASQDEGEER